MKGEILIAELNTLIGIIESDLSADYAESADVSALVARVGTTEAFTRAFRYVHGAAPSAISASPPHPSTNGSNRSRTQRPQDCSRLRTESILDRAEDCSTATTELWLPVEKD